MKKVYIKRNDLFENNVKMVLCNNIIKVDESFIEDNYGLFSTPCEACEGSEIVQNEDREQADCSECMGDGSLDAEPFQYFLCRINDYTKEYLEEWGVSIGYSETLDLHVIAIYDFGTSWDMFSYSKEVDDDYQLGKDESFERITAY
jgi:hypothetical protein